MAVPQKTAKDLLEAFYNGDPIVGDLITAISSGSSAAINSVLDKYGYNVTSKELQTVLQLARVGSSFNIAIAAGVYKFENGSPSDLSSSTMLINPADKSLTIDKSPVLNQLTRADTGHVEFDYGSYSYDLLFVFSYDGQGQPKPIVVTCKRQLITGKDQDPDFQKPASFSANQVTATSPPVDWSQLIGSVQAGFVMTALGLFFTIAFYAVDKGLQAREHARDAKEKEKAEIELQEMKSKATETLNKVRDVAWDLVDSTNLTIKLAEFRNDIINQVKSSLADAMRAQPNDASPAENHVAAAAAAASAVRDAVQDNAVLNNQESIINRMGAVGDLLPIEAKNAMVQQAVVGAVSSIPIYQDPASSQMLNDLADQAVSHHVSQQSDVVVQEAQTKIAKIEADLAANKQTFDEAQQAAQKAHQDPKSDPKVRDIEQEINRQKVELQKEQDRKAEAQRAKQQADDDAEESEVRFHEHEDSQEFDPEVHGEP